MVLSAFERVVSLMEAEEIDAPPIMATGPIQSPNKPEKKVQDSDPQTIPFP